MGDGGQPHYFLSEIHKHYPLSMHGVGLSLGSADGIDGNHLEALSKVIERHQPEQVSEHLSWSRWHTTYLNDLLPLPYTEEFLRIVVDNINQVQDRLKRRLLVENPSVYLAMAQQDYTETEFLTEIVKRSGCGLLLDVNNVYVSATNQNTDPNDYLRDYPMAAVGEIHLAGHVQSRVNERLVLIDDHGSPVIDEVWHLFEQAIDRLRRPVPVLVEWDTDVPALSTLLLEADKARTVMERRLSREAVGNYAIAEYSVNEYQNA